MKNASSFLDIFEQAYRTKVWDQRLDASGEFLMELSRRGEFDKIVWAFYHGKVDFIWGYIDLLPKQVLQKEAYNLCRRLLDEGSEEYAQRALRSAIDKSLLSQDLFYNSLVLGSCQKDDVEVFAFAQKLHAGHKNGFTSNGFATDDLDIILEHHCKNILAWFKNHEDGRKLKLVTRALRCVNLKNHKGLEMVLAWHNECFGSSEEDNKWLLAGNVGDFFGAMIKNPSKKTWDVLKKFGFLDASCSAVKEMGKQTSSLAFSENVSLSFFVINECIERWEKTGQDWVTPFMGEMSAYPVCLNQFLEHFPQYIDEGMAVVGRHYVFEQKNSVSSLYRAYEKQQMLKEVSTSNKTKQKCAIKKM